MTHQRSYSGRKAVWRWSSGPSLRESTGGNVPLSEHEQRQLEQIEQALYAEHPPFARAVRAADPRVHSRRRLIQATLGFLVGVGLLVAGVLTKDPWIGAGGFVVLLTCSMWAL